MESESYEELCQRRAELEQFLQRDFDSNMANNNSNIPPNHWDHVMKEALWLSEDVAKERIRLQNQAKKHVKSLETHFKTLEQRQVRKAKNDLLALRKIATKISKDVKRFWTKIDKVVAFTQKIESDEVRQKAMDKHLKALVDLTEKYSHHLAKNMHKIGLEDNKNSDDFGCTDNDSSSDSGRHGRVSSSRRRQQLDETLLTCSTIDEDADGTDGADDDGSFAPSGDDEGDNESTLLEQEAWERQQNGAEEEDELAALQREGEMSIDELRRMYSGMGSQSEDEDDEESEDEEGEDDSKAGRDSEAGGEDVKAEPFSVERQSHSTPEGGDDDGDDVGGADGADDDGSFAPSGDDEGDNESTLLEQEAWERQQNGAEEEDELAALQREGEMSIDELRRMYSGMGSQSEDEDEEEDDEPIESWRQDGSVTDMGRNAGGSGGEVDSCSVDTSFTQRSTSVSSSPSFLMAPSLRLREYQQYGVQWLCSMEANGLNGILADEMGLGKTVQTIGMLASLASAKGIWGPHLIVAPTSCIVNWETEVKKFCPAFKVLTYFGSAKARKQLRQGWSKLNSFHICITSYQLVVQDANAFRRKKWYYMILDEAHNIKNFKSKRWQTLMNFDSFRRLLLTGTPLQNNLLELWSLMHFLMPHIFKSRKEFAYWFSNPLENALENAKAMNNDIVGKLHNIIRPFILRRLKADVAQQLPKKFEHIVFCKLSKRQKLLYEEFISAANNKNKASEKSYLAMMNLLMQLRKVCDHPDLVEPRLIGSPYCFEGFHCEEVRVLSKDGLKIDLSAGYVFWEDVDCQMPFLPTAADDRCLSTEGGSGWFARYLSEEQRRARLRRQNGVDLYNRRLTLKNASRTFASTVQSAQALQSLLGRSLSEWNDDDLTSVATTEVRALLHVPYLVFRLPRVISPGIRSRQVAATSPMEVSKVLTRYIEFPDKKMVQFDSGKLVELYRLLYSKRRNGHKCLIFTQMSRMLDILELFLNLHDFSFVRLDGSTSVDERQKLMDRFNADPKLFCFILSTRSGGLGVNLTGADTVIFYDTDWNPAMDAQAQDRAHRIGQTREVHIYRLVSEGTIEENILRKAQQRKDLDSLVINKGNFSEDGLLSMHSLRSMFGDESRDAAGVEGDPVTAKDMEAAMLAVEDAEDVAAIQVVQNEVNDNEKIDSTDAGADRSEDAGDDAAGDGAQEETEATDALPSTTATAAGGDDEPDPEFELLKRKVGDSIASIHSALSSIDRYAVHFRTRCDPFISPFYVNAQVQLESLLQSTDNEMELIAEHEAVQEQQEREAMEKGEVIYAPSVAERDFVVKRWFSQQRRTKKYLRHLRAVTGDCWKHLFDNDGFPFWQNEDTGAFSYTTPQVISMKEDFLFARQRGYAGLPVGILANILSYLVAYPDRMECSRSCAKWWEASRGDDLLLKVYPVESGIRDTTRDRPVNVFSSIQDAIDASGPGDTIMLYRGHYWENGLHIRWPLKVLADVEESTDCVVELKGAVAVHHSARTCVFHSLTLRGAGKFVWDSLIYVASSRLLMSNCILDNTLTLSANSCAVVGGLLLASKCSFVKGESAIVSRDSIVLVDRCTIEGVNFGVKGWNTSLRAIDTCVTKCSAAVVFCRDGGIVSLRHCDLRGNSASLLDADTHLRAVVWKNNLT